MFRPIYYIMNRINDIKDLPKRFLVLCCINCTPGFSLMWLPMDDFYGTKLVIVVWLLYLVLGQVKYNTELINHQTMVDKLKRSSPTNIDSEK